MSASSFLFCAEFHYHRDIRGVLLPHPSIVHFRDLSFPLSSLLSLARYVSLFSLIFSIVHLTSSPHCSNDTNFSFFGFAKVSK
jgi:hypothetical protein